MNLEGASVLTAAKTTAEISKLNADADKSEAQAKVALIDAVNGGEDGGKERE
jgi:hypothetical protein